MFTKSYSRTLLFTLIVLNNLWGQTKPQITNISIEVKRNGAFIQLQSSAPIDKKNITGWAADNGWFYLTVYNGITDTTLAAKTRTSYPVTAVEVVNTNESTQISYQIAQEIETFEFYQSTNPPEILLSLRFPVEDVKEELVQHIPPEVSLTKRKIGLPYYGRFRTALYIVGSSLTFAGILDQDNKSQSSWELISGVAILSGTYIYDQYIRPKILGEKTK